jgi:hypothetical protein
MACFAAVLGQTEGVAGPNKVPGNKRPHLDLKFSYLPFPQFGKGLLKGLVRLDELVSHGLGTARLTGLAALRDSKVAQDVMHLILSDHIEA